MEVCQHPLLRLSCVEVWKRTDCGSCHQTWQWSDNDGVWLVFSWDSDDIFSASDLTVEFGVDVGVTRSKT